MDRHAPSSTGAGLYERTVRALDGALEPVSPCPVCGVEQAHARFAIEGMEPRLVVCPECGLGRLYPMPGPEAVREFYPDAYYGEPGSKFQPLIERLVRWVGARHIAFLSAGLPPGARVLDVGCGRGVILGALADRGFQVHGVEISAEAARGADPRAEIRIATHLRDAGYKPGSFDEVVIWHVLEHLHDPRGCLEEVHRVLRPGGRLVVAVPNLASLQARWTGAAWFHLDLPRHLYHFPIDALRRLLTDTGFSVESEHHFSVRQNPFGWIQSFLNARESLPRNGLYELLQRRAAGGPPPFDASVRWRLWLGLLAIAPLSLVLTALETLVRSGATVHLVARRGTGSR
jgi:2-polyprenyl-3-methyl-5-hydroxy-6-metoxy-1,4-benzoquinol methylase